MLVLRGGTLIDGTGRPPVRDASLVLNDGRVEAVVTGPAANWAPGAEVVDVQGATILPGLIDCHDHLAFHGYELSARWELNEQSSTRHLRTARVIEQTLRAGYTTIRDAGGLDAGFRTAIDEGLISGPRLLTAVAIISPVGGIGDRVSPSGHEACLIPNDPALPRGVANGVEDVRRVVRTMIRAGADVIKCATTGGASSRAGREGRHHRRLGHDRAARPDRLPRPHGAARLRPRGALGTRRALEHAPPSHRAGDRRDAGDGLHGGP